MRWLALRHSYIVGSSGNRFPRRVDPDGFGSRIGTSCVLVALPILIRWAVCGCADLGASHVSTLGCDGRCIAGSSAGRYLRGVSLGASKCTGLCAFSGLLSFFFDWCLPAECWVEQVPGQLVASAAISLGISAPSARNGRLALQEKSRRFSWKALPSTQREQVKDDTPIFLDGLTDGVKMVQINPGCTQDQFHDLADHVGGVALGQCYLVDGDNVWRSGSALDMGLTRGSTVTVHGRMLGGSGFRCWTCPQCRLASSILTFWVPVVCWRSTRPSREAGLPG